MPAAARARSPRLVRWLVLGGLALLGVLVLLPALVPSLNPFREETRDRSQPVLLKSLEDLSEYRAASANLQVMVDLERDAALLPRFLKGERTLLLATGSVDAAVDFSALGRRPGAVQVSEDRRSVRISLPEPQLTEPRIDPDRSRVVDRDRGLLDRVGDAVGDDPTNDQAVYRAAEDKLAEAAASDEALRERARGNTRDMLVAMMRALGFERVTVEFRPPAEEL